MILQEQITDYFQFENWLGVISKNVIKKYNLCLSKADDYRSAARVGLVEAMSRYNAEKGDCFEKYAYRRVKGAIIDAIRSDSLLSVAAYRHAKKLEESFSCEDSSVIPNGGHGLLAKKIEYSEEFLLKFDAEETPETHYARKELIGILKKQISSLSEEEKYVIFEHYFNEKSLAEIGLEFAGQSRSWASRVHLKALKRLKKLCLQLEIM